MGKFRVTTEDGKSYVVTTEDPKSDWKGIVGQSVKDIFQKPASYAKNLATNPEAMANALPPALSTAGGVMYPFGGGTAGMAVGQGIRDLALKGLKKDIPGIGQHAMELGGAAVGDALSGLSQAKYFGERIGQAEKAAGLQNVPKEPPPSNMRTAVKMAQKIKEIPNMSPEQAKALKPAMDSVWQSGFITKGAYKQYLPDFVEARNVIQNAINKVPGRAEASKELARVYTVPRVGGKPFKYVWNKLPAWAARGLRWGVIGVP